MGAAFGRFRLERRLAVGGMAEVHLASSGPDRPLAVVKILLSNLREDPDYVAMFEDEARMGLQLAHPNIVGIFETGRVGDVPFIALEFVDGENLRAVLHEAAKGALVPPEIAARIAIGILLGLDHAHRARDANGKPLNLVHRDLTPDNVLLSWDGEPKILDFGIAKADGRVTHTQAGVLKGKALYMPPEQARGVDVDTRADVFAVGLVLHEMLLGKRRFDHIQDAIGALLAAQDWKGLPASKPISGIAELDAIVRRAVEPDPSARFQTTGEMAIALTRLVQLGVLPKAPPIAAWLADLFPGRQRVVASPTPTPRPVLSPMSTAQPAAQLEDNQPTLVAKQPALERTRTTTTTAETVAAPIPAAPSDERTAPRDPPLRKVEEDGKTTPGFRRDDEPTNIVAGPPKDPETSLTPLSFDDEPTKLAAPDAADATPSFDTVVSALGEPTPSVPPPATAPVIAPPEIPTGRYRDVPAEPPPAIEPTPAVPPPPAPAPTPVGAAAATPGAGRPRAGTPAPPWGGAAPAKTPAPVSTGPVPASPPVALPSIPPPPAPAPFATPFPATTVSPTPTPSGGSAPAKTPPPVVRPSGTPMTETALKEKGAVPAPPWAAPSTPAVARPAPSNVTGIAAKPWPTPKPRPPSRRRIVLLLLLTLAAAGLLYGREAQRAADEAAAAAQRRADAEARALAAQTASPEETAAAVEPTESPASAASPLSTATARPPVARSRKHASPAPSPAPTGE